MKKIFTSFTYANAGIKQCFTNETNFKIHVLAAVLSIVFGFVLNISVAEWITIIFCIGFVMAMEMLNTAVETLCDVVHQGIHPKIKIVKDITAGAVLIAAISSTIIGGIIFLPKLFILLK